MSSTSMSRRLSIALLSVSALAAHANAQSSSAPASPPRADSVVVHRLPVDASKIQPARFSYRLVITRDTVASPLGDQESSIAAIDYSGTPAFLFVRGGQQGVTTTTDSLTVRRADLQPLHWIASQGVAHVAAEFTPDTIFG